MHSTRFFSTLYVVLATLSVVSAVPQRNGGNNNNNNNNQNQNQNQDQNQNGNNNGGNAGAEATLLAANIQEASNSDGDPDTAAGQSPSDTDAANFINFCSGKTITNGAQVTGGSCNGIGKWFLAFADYC